MSTNVLKSLECSSGIVSSRIVSSRIVSSKNVSSRIVSSRIDSSRAFTELSFIKKKLFRIVFSFLDLSCLEMSHKLMKIGELC